jgi:hypothetical protein
LLKDEKEAEEGFGMHRLGVGLCECFAKEIQHVRISKYQYIVVRVGLASSGVGSHQRYIKPLRFWVLAETAICAIVLAQPWQVLFGSD